MSLRIIQKNNDCLQLKMKEHFSFVNAIRRAILSYCPAKSLRIDIISRNDSGINNDLIKQRVSLIWVPQKINNLVVSLDVTNNTQKDFMEVGPDMFKCQLNLGETLKSVDNPWKKQKSKIVITKLRPGESISFEATVHESTAFKSGGEYTAAHAFFSSSSDSEHLFTVESRLRESPVETWNRTLHQLQMRLARIKSKSDLSKKEKSDKILIKLEGENHTIGNALTYQLNQLKEVKNAGYDMPHPLIEEILIRVETNGDAMVAFLKGVDQLSAKFGKIRQ